MVAIMFSTPIQLCGIPLSAPADSFTSNDPCLPWLRGMSSLELEKKLVEEFQKADKDGSGHLVVVGSEEEGAGERGGRKNVKS